MTKTFSFDEKLFSDLHKDAYGFRPARDHNFYVVQSPETKEEIWSGVIFDLEMSIEREKTEKTRNGERFEILISTNIAIGAKDRKTAIRWLLEAEDLIEDMKFYGGEAACYRFGLPYSMDKELEEAIK